MATWCIEISMVQPDSCATLFIMHTNTLISHRHDRWHRFGRRLCIIDVAFRQPGLLRVFNCVLKELVIHLLTDLRICQFSSRPESRSVCPKVTYRNRVSRAVACTGFGSFSFFDCKYPIPSQNMSTPQPTKELQLEEDHNEGEVDASLIYSKKQTKLRTVEGSILLFNVDVYECASPYVMIFVVKTQQEHDVVRMDVHKEDLARELRLWLEGKIIRSPAVIVSNRIEGLMQGFVNFGKTPKQEDLISWILSRSELLWGRHSKMSFGGLPRTEFDEFGSAVNRFQKTVDAHNEFRNSQPPSIQGRSFNSTALKDTINTILQEQEQKDHPPPYIDVKNPKLRRSATANTVISPTKRSMVRSSSANKASTSYTTSYKPNTELVDKSNVADVATFALMSKLLGKSAAIAQLKKSKLQHVLPPSHKVTPYDAEIERRKTLRAAQLSACKLLRSGGKKYPEEKKALPPARRSIPPPGPPRYNNHHSRRFGTDGQEIYEDDGHDSVTRPPPYGLDEMSATLSVTTIGDHPPSYTSGRKEHAGTGRTTKAGAPGISSAAYRGMTHSFSYTHPFI